MSIGDVDDQLRAILASLPDAQLDVTFEGLEEAQQHLSAAAQGSQADDLPRAIQLCALGKEQLETVRDLLGRLRSVLDGYIKQAGVRGSGSGTAIAQPPPPAAAAVEHAVVSASPPTPNAAPKQARTPNGQRISRERAKALQAEMPSPVVSGRGQKTHGRWVDEHGKAHPIVSGQDEDAAEASRLLQAKGYPLPGEPTTVMDVEQKLAARMVREKRQHLEVVLNNLPCEGPLGCDVLVPVILPEGYSLTVHGPGYWKRFTGGAKPWWR